MTIRWKNSFSIIPLRKACLYFTMEETTMIVLKEVYLTSWSKCLFRINSLFLKETFGQKSYFILLDTSVSCMLYFVYPFGGYNTPSFWFGNYIPYIILVFFHHEFVLSDHQHILVFCIQLWRLEPTLLLVKSRSIKKMSIMLYHVELKYLL